MGENEMVMVADWMNDAVEAVKRGDEAGLERIADEVAELAAAFPIPGVAL